jgi:hypothetical protein
LKIATCAQCKTNFNIENYEYKRRKKRAKNLFCNFSCMSAWTKTNKSRPTDEIKNKICTICNEEKEINEFTRKGKDNNYRHNYCRKCLYYYQKRRWNKVKIRAIIYLGGKCKKCDLVDHPTIYDFHHRDKTQKEVDWSELKIRKWESIKLELDKCDLLCCLCHRKEHTNFGLWDLSYVYKQKEINYCLICSKQIKRGKYCSSICASKAQERIKWPDNLKELAEKQSLLSLARSLGVSDVAIKKRLMNHHKF